MTIVKHSIDAETAEKASRGDGKEGDRAQTQNAHRRHRRGRRYQGLPSHGRRAEARDRYRTEQGLHHRVIFDAAHAWFDFIKDDPPLLYGITHTPRLTVFGGGFPIKLEGEIVGAIGLSGGHYTQDMECARAGLAAIGAEPF